MALPDTGDNLLAKLQSTDPAEQARHDEQVQLRLAAQYQKAQRRTLELFDANATLPTTLSEITVLNANRTRRSLLSRIFDPILSGNQKEPYTLGEAIAAVGHGIDRLNRLDIFESPISVYFDRPDPTDPSSTPTDLTAYLSVREKSRVLLNVGTWVGSNDGSITSNLALRNIFGGAESLNATASRGARTRSAYSANFDTPILSNSDLRFELSGLASTTNKTWASHEEVLQGGNARLRWLTSGAHLHELAYSGTWRQITGLAPNASPTVRGDAGDSFKSSLSHTWTNDRRDHPLIPSGGYLLKSVTELAGAGLLKGDVAFGKLELETQGAMLIPVPFTRQDPGISFTLGLRGGVLYPLALSGQLQPQTSRINDRFTLGGPTDVRGFRLGGLGPRDGPDAAGGDVYAAGGASLLFPFPRIGKDAPLRLQTFINSGRLLGLQDPRGSEEKREGMSHERVRTSVGNAITELGNGLPSTSVGLGVIYALSMARFELNFSLPLVVRSGEESRKGLTLGVGLSFL